MTRPRLAAIAALSLAALLVVTSIGEAQRPTRYRATSKCRTKHTMTRDFAKFKTEVAAQEDPHGPGRRGSTAVVFQPVEGAKVITKLYDETPANGDNVLTFKRKATTNAKGVARTKHEFNNFGNYRATIKVKVDGDVVDESVIRFGVSDRVSGACGPPLAQ